MGDIVRPGRRAVAKLNNTWGRADSFNACAVVDQPSREQVGIAVIQIVKQLADILAHRHFQLHAEIVGELLRQFIVQTIFLPLITE